MMDKSVSMFDYQRAILPTNGNFHKLTINLSNVQKPSEERDSRTVMDDDHPLFMG